MIQFLVCLQSIVSIQSLETSSCLAYGCSSGPTRDTCVEVLSSSIYLSPCVTGLVCDTDMFSAPVAWKKVKCSKGTLSPNLCEDTSLVLYTGQTCCVSSNCDSGNCTNSQCDGNAEGSSCVIDEQCMPGDFCSAGICTQAITSNCNYDNQCPVGFGCNNTNCIQLHTLVVGEYAERAIFCNTGFLYNNRCDAVQGYVSGTKLNSTRKCYIGDTCMYYTVNQQILIESSLCMCSGIANSVVGYCGRFANVSTDVIPFYKALLYTSSDCSGNYSHTDEADILLTCGSITQNQFNYGNTMIDSYSYFNLYASGSIDHCVRPLGLFDPWYNPASYSMAEFLIFNSVLIGVYLY